MLALAYINQYVYSKRSTYQPPRGQVKQNPPLQKAQRGLGGGRQQMGFAQTVVAGLNQMPRHTGCPVHLLRVKKPDNRNFLPDEWQVTAR